MLRRLNQWLYGYLIRHNYRIGTEVYVEYTHVKSVVDVKGSYGLNVPTERNWEVKLTPEFDEWLATCGPHFVNLGSSFGGWVWFYRNEDAVEFKLKFL